MNRLPSGVLKKLSAATGLKVNYLCDLAADRKRPGRKRALELESACKEIGTDVPAILWLYGKSSEIKAALSGVA